ncbi:cytochrome c [Roseiconus lacunae]|uniref:cytochrome c n=1 Tax=Roseiconus lacunae TaxID=2605694 RepID=UPI001E54E02F|nr:cytochrome c [Roseiconus lacunae]MCD0458423.1 c-type cytochrome [Roseiconus lacunae]
MNATRISLSAGTFAVISVALICGCDSSVKQFPPNRVHALVVEASRDVPTDAAMTDVERLVSAWFGTPDEPRWPAEWIESSAGKRLVNLENLTRASGRVYSDKQNRHFGLYTEHCVTCHGIAGGGDGPASLLQNPYPRDVRAGIFKWKSTERASKPTRDDLAKLLLRGAPGTGMPSFSSVGTEDREALVDYIIYLAVRGEFERKLLADAVDELGYEDSRPDDDANLATLASLAGDADPNRRRHDALEVAQDRLNEVVDSWSHTEKEVISVPPETPFDTESVRRGREIFHGVAGGVVNCAGCHGPDGDGTVTTVDFDDWTKEFTTRLSISPEDRDAVKPFRDAGALRPRQIFPRKLNQGIYRGGGKGETLYRRVVAGIAGTPMPASPVKEQASATCLTPDQVWDVVHYVQSLGGARPTAKQPNAQPSGDTPTASSPDEGVTQ